jgi:hypothetical protein
MPKRDSFSRVDGEDGPGAGLLQPEGGSTDLVAFAARRPFFSLLRLLVGAFPSEITSAPPSESRRGEDEESDDDGEEPAPSVSWSESASRSKRLPIFAFYAILGLACGGAAAALMVGGAWSGARFLLGLLFPLLVVLCCHALTCAQHVVPILLNMERVAASSVPIIMSCRPLGCEKPELTCRIRMRQPLSTHHDLSPAAKSVENAHAQMKKLWVAELVLFVVAVLLIVVLEAILALDLIQRLDQGPAVVLSQALLFFIWPAAIVPALALISLFLAVFLVALPWLVAESGVLVRERVGRRPAMRSLLSGGDLELMGSTGSPRDGAHPSGLVRAPSGGSSSNPSVPTSPAALIDPVLKNYEELGKTLTTAASFWTPLLALLLVVPTGLFVFAIAGILIIGPEFLTRDTAPMLVGGFVFALGAGLPVGLLNDACDGTFSPSSSLTWFQFTPDERLLIYAFFRDHPIGVRVATVRIKVSTVKADVVAKVLALVISQVKSFVPS